MEARLAAHGSGAAARSAEFGQRYLNIDIGGATTKLAVCEGGRVVATAALAIGGRLVATDTDDRIVRLEPAGAMHGRPAGFDWAHGRRRPLVRTQSRRCADGRHSDRRAHRLRSPAMRSQPLSLTGPLPSFADIDAMMVSGGVGEYVYGRETRSFGDLGLPLGRALADRIAAGALPWPLHAGGRMHPRNRARRVVIQRATVAAARAASRIRQASCRVAICRWYGPACRSATCIDSDDGRPRDPCRFRKPST